jgi:hypothetical protein
MDRRLLAALALAAAACEPEPCPKDTVLGPAQTPCDCDGAIIEGVDCGSVSCTSYGPAWTTLADTGCGSTTTTTTPE